MTVLWVILVLIFLAAIAGLTVEMQRRRRRGGVLGTGENK